MMVCTQYGVFAHAGIPYLIQDGEAKDALGQNLPSPFTLDLDESMRRLAAPHAIDLHQPAPKDKLPQDFINNALVNVYLPKPNFDTQPQVVFIRAKNMDPFPILRRLAELSSMNSLATVIYEKEREDAYYKQLKLTNLGPLTLVGVSVANSMPIYGLTEFARVSRRNLVITGHADIPTPAGVRDMTDSYHSVLQIMDEMPVTNMRQQGAQFFKRWMELYYKENQPKGEAS